MSSGDAGTNRDCWLDWCRFFAVSAIVFSHCVEEFYYPIVSKNSRTDCLTSVVLFTIGRLGVPVFLFLSGYLLPGRYQITGAIDYRNFIMKKWLPLLVCAEIWMLVYGIALVPFSPKLHWYDVFSWMLFNSKVPLSHWWYMPMILGAYLGVPMLSVLKSVLGRKFILCLFILSLFVHVVRPYVNIGFLDFSFVGNCYITYILWGYSIYLFREELFRRMSSGVQLALLVVFAVNFMLCVYCQVRGEFARIWYTRPVLITAGVLVPLLLRTLPRIQSRILTVISVSSFGIYLIHNLVLRFLKPILSISASGLVNCVFAWFAAMAISILIILAFGRLKKVSRFLFLVK